MLGWLILLNTSESLASKTTLMTKFVVIALVLYRPARGVVGQRVQAGRR